MNTIITEKKEKRYLPHDINTRKHAVEMYRNCGDINYVCRKYHISRVSLWRWNKAYDGTKESGSMSSFWTLFLRIFLYFC